jgi:hypothetical protein
VVALRDEGRGMNGDALQQLAALNRISRIALQDMALRPMLQRIVDALHDEFGWEFIAFAGIDHARGEFVCDAVRAAIPSEVSVGYRRALGSGVVGHVAAHGRNRRHCRDTRASAGDRHARRHPFGTVRADHPRRPRARRAERRKPATERIRRPTRPARNRGRADQRRLARRPTCCSNWKQPTCNCTRPIGRWSSRRNAMD